MIRTQILGLGSYVPDRVVTNEELPYLDAKHVRQAVKQTETDDAWIQQRTGIKERRYVPNDGSQCTSDLALHASRRALADANVEPTAVDCIIFATLSPDFHFPGTGVYVIAALAGLTDVDAITLSMAERAHEGADATRLAVQAIVVATAANTLVKAALAAVLGRSLARPIAIGTAAVFAVGALALGFA